MGYITEFFVTLLDPTSFEPLPTPAAQRYAARILATRTLSGWADSFNPITDNRDDPWLAAKWYDHESNLKDATATVTGPVVRLHGVGEEHGDEWVKYFYRGEVWTARREMWTFPIPPVGTFREPLEPIIDAIERRAEVKQWLKRLPHEAHCPAIGRANIPCTCAASLVRQALDV